MPKRVALLEGVLSGTVVSTRLECRASKGYLDSMASGPVSTARLKKRTRMGLSTGEKQASRSGNFGLGFALLKLSLKGAFFVSGVWPERVPR